MENVSMAKRLLVMTSQIWKRNYRLQEIEINKNKEHWTLKYFYW